MVINMPEKVIFIINTLMDHGFEAFAVGGCVRDAILGREPKDWDITTSAKPDQVKRLFRRTIDTGIVHGTVTVMLNKEGFEITTYRIDGEYEDNRHPKSVEFTMNLVEDLKRRDFTMNAMAYNHIAGLVDEFGGKEDLKQHRVVCVGNPIERFQEDALRMLRAIRFSGQLDFEIEQETKEAIQKLAGTIENISKERIRVEIDKLICSSHSEKMGNAYRLGLTKYILPELDKMYEMEQHNPHYQYNIGKHCLKSVDVFNNQIKRSQRYKRLHFSEKMESAICWTLLLHDVGKVITKTTDENGVDHFYDHDSKGEKMAVHILKNLKFDNYTVKMVSTLIKWHDYRYGKSDKLIRKMLSRVGKDYIYPLLCVQYADVLSKSSYQLEQKLIKLDNVSERINRILNEKQCITIKELQISGKDLIEDGFEPGKKIGEVLNKLLDFVLEYPDRNIKEILLKEAGTYK